MLMAIWEKEEEKGGGSTGGKERKRIGTAYFQIFVILKIQN